MRPNAPQLPLTVLPMATRVAAALAHWLSHFMPGDLTLRPDLDQVPALAVERDQQWRRVGEASFLTVGCRKDARLLGPAPAAERAIERARARWAARR